MADDDESGYWNKEQVFKTIDTDALNCSYTFGPSSLASPKSPKSVTIDDSSIRSLQPDENIIGRKNGSDGFTPRSNSDGSMDFTFGPGGLPCAQMANTPVEMNWNVEDEPIPSDSIALEASVAQEYYRKVAIDDAEIQRVRKHSITKKRRMKRCDNTRRTIMRERKNTQCS